MKTCSNCSTQNSATTVFCTGCGAGDTGQGANQPAQQSAKQPPHNSFMAGPKLPPLDKKTKMLAVAGVVLGTTFLAYMIWFFALRDTTGLVGTWEAIDSWYETTVQFNRNGTGIVTEHRRGLIEPSRFEWEIIGDSYLLWITIHNFGRETSTVPFNVSSNWLEMDGDSFRRLR